MSITPLDENIDLKDHYLAFIELGNFGIQNEIPDERFVCRNHNRSDYFSNHLQVICSAVKGYHPTQSSTAVRISEEIQLDFLSEGLSKYSEELLSQYLYSRCEKMINLTSLEC